MIHNISDIQKPQFFILWFFFLPIIFYTIIDVHKIEYILALLLQISLLYLMFYTYLYYAQRLIKNYFLPISVELKKINMSINFSEPHFFKSIEKDNKLNFKVFLHNDYFKKDYPYKSKLIKKINYHVLTVWKLALLELRKYKIYLAYTMIYCFIFGVLLLLIFIITNSLINWENDYTPIYKGLYLFFTFISFSFWLYLTIQILISESYLNKTDDSILKNEVFVIFNNSNIFMDSKELNRLHELISTYINVSSGILYMSFLTILSIIF